MIKTRISFSHLYKNIYNYIYKKRRGISLRQLLLGAIALFCLGVFLILSGVISTIIHRQETQSMAERWGKNGDAAQISCFFSTDAFVSEDGIKGFEHGLDTALQEASITQESQNPGARLWADAYSARGQITISSDRATVSADAIGIGGDFFLFHPLRLLKGSFFSGNDLMQDYCVLDEDAAWQLFGSNDIAGMTVTIRGIPHIVTGVIRREEGRFAEAAGLDSTLVYVSYQTLSTLGSTQGINHYEIVMPNPVTNYAYNYVRDSIGVTELEMDILENGSRYSFLNRLKTIAAFGTRSMNGKAILYPYWENVARGYEDVLALLTLISLLFLVYPLILLIICVIRWWKNKTWTVKSVYLKLKDKAERMMEKVREEIGQRKEQGGQKRVMEKVRGKIGQRKEQGGQKRVVEKVREKIEQIEKLVQIKYGHMREDKRVKIDVKYNNKEEKEEG